jgi:hypothetical protein
MSKPRAIAVSTVVALASALVAVSGGSAAVANPISAANWSSPPPTGGCGVLSVISGDCSVPSDAFSPGSGGMTLDPVDGDALSIVQEGAEVLPAFSTLSALSTLVLAAGAFQLGWHIGSTVNNKWLHLYGVGLGDTSGFSTGGGTM